MTDLQPVASKARDEFREGDGFNCDRLFHKPVEQLASVSGCPSVEPERELVQVVIQLVS